MKKIALSLAVACMAVFATEGGFVGENTNRIQRGGFVDTVKPAKMSVKEALNAKDDTRCILQGKILREIKDEKYEFSDGKHSIIAEIDDDIWRGLVVTPSDFVEIDGYIDNDPFERTEIEVKRIRKIK